jgi:hypothetical protein
MTKPRALAILFVWLTAGAISAQTKDTTWRVHGFFGLNASQTALSNWQGGGQDNISIGSIFNLEAIYSRDKFEQWFNKIDMQLGSIRQGNASQYKKNLDQLFALTRYSTKAFGKYWYYLAQLDYRSQLTPGYNYSGDTISGRAVSDLNSPGYIQLALGLDFKPVEYFSVTFAPLSGKITHVNRQYLANEGAYGVEKAVTDSTGRIITPGKRTRYEFGGRIMVRFKKDIFKNVNFDSYLDLFTNYLVKPGNVDVVFNNLLTFKINKYFTANIISRLLYDDDNVTKRDWDKDGKYESEGDINGPRVQVMTTMSIGFGYKF